MANKNGKVSENVLGKYYVDQNCVICGMCADIAPDNFKMATEHAFVYKQPEDGIQKGKCQQAFMQCPVGAIGDDGER